MLAFGYPQQSSILQMKVLQASRGIAVKLSSQGKCIRVDGQAEHVSYLQAGDRVLVAQIACSNYVLAKLLQSMESPSARWQQPHPNQVVLDCGRSNVRIERTGQMIFANHKSSWMLHENGDSVTAAQTIQLQSHADVLIQTSSGKIQCFYPEDT